MQPDQAFARAISETLISFHGRRTAFFYTPLAAGISGGVLGVGKHRVKHETTDVQV